MSGKTSLGIFFKPDMMHLTQLKRAETHITPCYTALPFDLAHPPSSPLDLNLLNLNKNLTATACLSSELVTLTATTVSHTLNRQLIKKLLKQLRPSRQYYTHQTLINTGIDKTLFTLSVKKTTVNYIMRLLKPYKRQIKSLLTLPLFTLSLLPASSHLTLVCFSWQQQLLLGVCHANTLLHCQTVTLTTTLNLLKQAIIDYQQKFSPITTLWLMAEPKVSQQIVTSLQTLPQLELKSLLKPQQKPEHFFSLRLAHLGLA